MSENKKRKRTIVGQICKNKDPNKANYIQFSKDVNLKAGDYLQAESKSFQLKSLAQAMSDGKISEEIGTEIRERVEKIPDWVIAQLILSQ